MIIGCSGSGKTKALLNLINKQYNIDRIYLYANDLSEPKYEYLIKKRENAGIKHIVLYYDGWRLDRLAAKISALSSGELRKYEYLTGEDLGYRLSVLEQTIFDDSHDKDDKKEGLLKRLTNIEKNQNINNNDENKETNYESESSSAKRKSIKKTSISDNECFGQLNGVFIIQM